MKPTQRITAALLLGISAALPVASSPAAAQEKIAVIDDRVFRSADLNGDGTISRREIVIYTDQVFISMDVNNNGELTPEEVLQWDPGYLLLAEELGRTDRFNAAKEEVFNTRDLNGDGTVAYDEYSVSSLYDFYKADVDRDGGLSKDEFVGKFRILDEVRSVLE